MNIDPWRLRKDRPLRAALVALQTRRGLQDLTIDTEPHPQALWLRHRCVSNLEAYLFTYGQNLNHYGLQLSYPGGENTPLSSYNAVENLSLDHLVELLVMHFAP